MNKFDNKYIFFDLDGTLTQSDLGITKSIQYALERNNMVSPSLEELRIFVGPPLGEKFIEVFGIDKETSNKLLESYRERYNTIGKFECNIYYGVKEMLSTLRDKGKVLCVATSKPEKSAKEVLEHFGILKYFDFVGGDTFEHTRASKSAVINYVAESMEIDDRNGIIMVGDTHYDVLGACNSGVKCIGVLYGYGTKDGLLEAGACALAETAADVAEMF